MPKLDIVNAQQIKSAAGEWLQAKSQGWLWTRPGVSPANLLNLDLDPFTSAGEPWVVVGRGPLILESTLVSNPARAGRGGWSFQAVAGAQYRISYDIATSANTGTHCRIISNPDFGSAGLVFNAPSPVQGAHSRNYTFTAPSNGTLWLGPALVQGVVRITINQYFLERIS